jgi:broad specificity phosphatase PhoE
MPDAASAPQRIWIARHGNRADFADPQWRQAAARPHDPPLSPDGLVQADELGRRLLGEGIAHVFTSPFLRAIQTASRVADILGLAVRIEHGLTEWLNLEWFPSAPEYLPLEEAAALFRVVATDYASAVLPSYPETWEQMEARMAMAATMLAERFPGDMLFIGHGATVLGICHALLKDRPEAISAPLCGLTRIARTPGGWRLELNGDTSHLSHGQDGLRFV